MNESTVSSAFQKKLREALPEAVVVKHADKSMIGMVDASVTYNGHTFWLEYKFIGPNTKGVPASFIRDGVWSPEEVAASSPTQYAMAQRLAKEGHCMYLFWVLDYTATRKRVAAIYAWHPINKAASVRRDNNNEAVVLLIDLMKHHTHTQSPWLW